MPQRYGHRGIAGSENRRASIGHPNMSELQAAIGAMRSYADLEKVIQRSLGRSVSWNWRVLISEQPCARSAGRTSRRACDSWWQSIRHERDAEGRAGRWFLCARNGLDRSAARRTVHFSYDAMAGFLAPYGSAEALKVARSSIRTSKAWFEKLPACVPSHLTVSGPTIPSSCCQCRHSARVATVRPGGPRQKC